MALARTQREWAILVNEFNICKKKLESKREALKIITKEWQSSKRESEIYKSKVNQLQQDLDKYITKERKGRQQTHYEYEQPPVQKPNLVSSHTSMDTLAQLVYEYKQANKALRHDFEELKKLYIESQEDVQLMRDRMRRQSSTSSSHGDESSDNITEGKEEHILQLEEYKEQLASLEQEIKSVKDENSDIKSERDYYKEKSERLNTQLNYILGADDQRLVDVDALVLDNKYLKEKLTLLEEERSLERESIQKYEAAFEKKKSKILNPGSNRLASYYLKHNTDHSLKTVADLRNVANILSETISEKNLALSHQRNANRILGKRVSELENKLKTLEVAGLWSLPGHRGYGSANLANHGYDEHDSPKAPQHFTGKDIHKSKDEILSSGNTELVKLSDSTGEVNDNIDYCKRRSQLYSPTSNGTPNCVVCHTKTSEKYLNNSRQKYYHLDALWGIRNYSSPVPSSTNSRKLSRVCSAPCLTSTWSFDETGETSD